MSFLSNVKYKYQTKILDDLLRSNHDSFIENLNKLKNDKDLYYSLSCNYIPTILAKNDVKINEPKIVWLNSFLREDLSYITNFLSFYLQRTKNFTDNICDIADEFLKIQNYFSLNEKIDFDKFVQSSLLYQWLPLNIENKDFQFILNLLPFYSSESGHNFTTPALSKSYLFVVDHPYSVFAKIKNLCGGDSDKAKNYMFNIDGKNIIESNKNKNFCPIQQPWHVHLSSWRDANVINSLKGKIIKLDELIKSPLDTLSSIIFHLIQSDIKLEMKYDIVEEFIENNNPNDQITIFENDEISNKDKKFISNFIKDSKLNVFDT